MKKSVRYSIVFILLLCLYSQGVFAEEIFSDYIEEDASETIDSIVYTAYEYSDYTGVRLSSNRYGSIILESEGSSSTAGPYTFTLDEILETDETVSFKITVEKQESSVSIDKEVSNSSATISDEITVTITITNEGDENADITYSEDMPHGASISSTPEITKGTSTTTQKSTIADVYWSGVLYSEESVTITYEITITDYPSTGSTLYFNDTTFTYEDDTGLTTGDGDEFTISLNDPLSVDFTSDSEEISIGEEVAYTVTLTNNLDTSLEVSSFVLELPTIPITSMDTELTETTNGYTWSGQLASFENLQVTFYVQPENAGTYSFGATATYDYNGEQTVSDTVAFSIEAADVVPEIILSSESYDGNEPIIIYYYVNNSDEKISYSNVKLKLTSLLFDTVNYVTALPINQKILIKKQNFTAPYTDTEMDYDITMEGELDSGETFETSETITINPSDFTSPYAVAYTIDGIDEENTNVTMTLTLLTPLALQPTYLAVVHTADPDYKKTISLTTDQITDLFLTQTYTRSWNIPIISFTDDSISLEVQLQYIDGSGTYYDTLDSVDIPVYHEISVEINETEELNETEGINETIQNDITEDSTVNETIDETPSLTITGEDEQSSKKWIWFVVILVCLGAFCGTFIYILKRKQKKSEIKKNIESLSGKKVEQKESIFARAKEIIIQEVPNPEEGYEKLESYIKHSFSIGKTEDETKKILVGKGWIEDVLDSYLRRLK
ncbi:MAG: hypothetical protein WC254_05905 [Candidatus Woesearchaeota archaeon]|jgi:hypothetical protein